ncbi:1-phosphofructokinase family hexose kinase [Nocardioides albus]|uniref:1-phosphofructokinase family hexose kinase n=1 Tax=Nocardioides albus TaxID=1841 RepID=A0A7W5A3T8_9ACTN|nr:hexose kinase [Nocardioides albus]MBB3089176.1 1-phosphofructokinase family hexose kinase [Nocardioides albus]GGU13759.1 sugar kinase [Nocardioides albus]
MILTVTLNPAIDVTYRLPRLTVGEVHRVAEVSTRLGGKGVNVARVLHQLGEPTHAVGLADNDFGRALARELPATFLPELDDVRRTLVVVAESTTSLWEPGHQTAPGADRRLLDLLADRIGEATALTVSGSLAPGVPTDLPARIARLAAAAGVPAILDLDDAALAAAVGTGAVLTPNEDEAARLLGHHPEDPVAAVVELAERHGGPVVLTRGRDGLLAYADGAVWEVRPPAGVSGNPTGAGDAAAAGLARGLAAGSAWPEILRDAAALGAAAVVVPMAGEIDPDAYSSFRTEVSVERIDLRGV